MFNFRIILKYKIFGSSLSIRLDLELHHRPMPESECPVRASPSGFNWGRKSIQCGQNCRGLCGGQRVGEGEEACRQITPMKMGGKSGGEGGGG